MENSNDAAKKCLQYFILLLETSLIRIEKDRCVRVQDFKSAAEFRKQETDLLELLPTLDEMRQLKSQLDTETNGK